ncbi:hypothetical protein BOX15_Mlig021709g1, partial [Macrostomum lignano]
NSVPSDKAYIMAQHLLLLTLLALLALKPACCLDNGVAMQPPMGWLTWQRFRCVTDCDTYPDTCIGEKLIRDTADRMAQDGWLASGYEFVTVDDCWASHQRDAQGRLQGDPDRFPGGMRALADYVHSRGLKFGIYADYGNLTCGGYPGSINNLQLDAQTFASWGVDLVKLDGCYSDPAKQAAGYAQFGSYLNKTGRPIVFSCSYPAYQEKKSSIDSALLQKTCSMWRIYGDIQDSWASVASIIDYWGSNDANMSTWNGPQHWNDPDMVIVGDFGLSPVQQEAQMAFWCLWSAPLILSLDLRSVPTDSARILRNALAIAINKDPMGYQGRLLFKRGDVQLWRKLMSRGDFAFVLYYNSDGGTPARLGVSLKDLALPAGLKPPFDCVDVFTFASAGRFADTDTAVNFDVLPSGGVRFVYCRRPASAANGSPAVPMAVPAAELPGLGDIL